MKNHLFKLIWLTLMMALTLSLFVPYTAVLASNTSQASYYAVIRVSNNGTSAAYNVSVPLSLNTSYLVNGGYMASNLSNTAMNDNYGNDAYYNPAVVTNTTWMIFVPYIPADSSIDYTLYMGGNVDMSGNKSWFSGTTGGTTANSTSLHLGSDFSITQTGYLDTSYYNNKNLTAKTGSLVCNVSAAGNVTATAYGAGSVTASGISSGYHTVIQSASQGVLTLSVDDNSQSIPLATTTGNFTQANDISGTIVWLYSGSYFWSGQYLSFPEGNITSVGFYLKKTDSPSGNVTCTIRDSSNNLLATMGSIDSTGLTTSYVWYQFNSNSYYNPITQNLSFQIEYNGPLGVTPAFTNSDDCIGYRRTYGNPGGWYNSTFNDQIIQINYSTYVAPPDTSASWQFATNNTWRYLESQTIEVNGATVQDISWQNAAIWIDASGYGNNMTPTFRTTTTHPNVSAVLFDFQTDNEAILTDWDLNSYTNNLDIPDMPGGMYDATPTFPGTGVVNDVSDAGGYPRSTLWFILPTVLIVAAGLLIHDKTKSLFAQTIITCLAVVFLSLIHVWAFWLIIPIGLISMAACLASKVLNY